MGQGDEIGEEFVLKAKLFKLFSFSLAAGGAALAPSPSPDRFSGR